MDQDDAREGRLHKIVFPDIKATYCGIIRIYIGIYIVISTIMTTNVP